MTDSSTRLGDEIGAAGMQSFGRARGTTAARANQSTVRDGVCACACRGLGDEACVWWIEMQAVVVVEVV